MNSNEQQNIDNLITSFYSIFDNRADKIPDFKALEDMFIAGAIITKRQSSDLDQTSVSDFISPRKEILTNGTLVQFCEWELTQHTIISNGIATRISTYAKQGYLNGQNYSGQGHKHIQLLSTSAGWKIASIIWEDD